MTKGLFPLGCAGAWNALSKTQLFLVSFFFFFQDRAKYVKHEFTFCSMERRYFCGIWHLGQEAKAIAHENMAMRQWSEILREHISNLFTDPKEGKCPPKKRCLWTMCPTFLGPYECIFSYQISLYVLYTRSNLGEMRSILKLYLRFHLLNTFLISFSGRNRANLCLSNCWFVFFDWRELNWIRWVWNGF